MVSPVLKTANLGFSSMLDLDLLLYNPNRGDFPFALKKKNTHAYNEGIQCAPEIVSDTPI